MVDKQVTMMVLKVDLQCWKCYKKVKKILCKFPRTEIQDQVFDKKQNIVTIRALCCSPNKIMQKIICKSGESMKSINVKVSKKPNKENPDKQGKDDNKPPNGKPTTSRPKQKPDKPDKKIGNLPDNCKGDKPQNVPPPPLAPAPVPVYQRPADPFHTCCTECYEGCGGAPCMCSGYGWPSAPLCYQYDSYLGRPITTVTAAEEKIATWFVKRVLVHYVGLCKY